MSWWEREKSGLNDVGPRKKKLVQRPPFRPVAPTGQTGRARLTKRLLTYGLLFRVETNDLN